MSELVSLLQSLIGLVTRPKITQFRSGVPVGSYFIYRLKSYRGSSGSGAVFVTTSKAEVKKEAAQRKPSV